MLMLLLTCGHHTMPLRDHFVSPVVVMWCDQVSWRQPTWTSIGSIKKFVTAAGPYQLVSQDSLKFFVCLKRQKEVTIENKHSVSSLLNESQKIRTVIHFLYKCKVFYFHSFVSRHRKNNKVSDWHVSKKNNFVPWVHRWKHTILIVQARGRVMLCRILYKNIRAHTSGMHIGAFLRLFLGRPRNQLSAYKYTVACSVDCSSHLITRRRVLCTRYNTDNYAIRLPRQWQWCSYLVKKVKAYLSYEKNNSAFSHEQTRE